MAAWLAVAPAVRIRKHAQRPDGERALARAAKVDARDAGRRVAAKPHRAVGGAERPALRRQRDVTPLDLQRRAEHVLSAHGGRRSGGRRGNFLQSAKLYCFHG